MGPAEALRRNWRIISPNVGSTCQTHSHRELRRSRTLVSKRMRECSHGWEPLFQVALGAFYFVHLLFFGEQLHVWVRAAMIAEAHIGTLHFVNLSPAKV